MGRKSNKQKAAEAAEAAELQAAMNGNTVPPSEPGNETALDARERRGHRPHVVDLPGITGDGVGRFSDKALDKIGDSFIDVRDRKAELASELTKLEEKAAERMNELGITRYEFSDQEMTLKAGKTHVKVKTVKSEGVSVANGD